MNTNLLKHSLTAAALASATLTVLANIEISLPLVGTVIAYGAAALILAFAAVEGVRRNS